MKMGRSMVVEEHPDDDTEERRDDRHGRIVAEREVMAAAAGRSTSARPRSASVPIAVAFPAKRSRYGTRPKAGQQDAFTPPTENRREAYGWFPFVGEVKAPFFMPGQAALLAASSARGCSGSGGGSNCKLLPCALSGQFTCQNVEW
jgi:hypothetical protein